MYVLENGLVKESLCVDGYIKILSLNTNQIISINKIKKQGRSI